MSEGLEGVRGYHFELIVSLVALYYTNLVILLAFTTSRTDQTETTMLLSLILIITTTLSIIGN